MKPLFIIIVMTNAIGCGQQNDNPNTQDPTFTESTTANNHLFKVSFKDDGISASTFDALNPKIIPASNTMSQPQPSNPQNALPKELYLSLVESVRQKNKMSASTSFFAQENSQSGDHGTFSYPNVVLKSYDETKSLATIKMSYLKSNMPIIQKWNLSGNVWKQSFYK